MAKKLKKELTHYIVEVILILSGVLIFRSSWTLLDKYYLLNTYYSLVIMLVIGIILTILSFNFLFKHEKKEH